MAKIKLTKGELKKQRDSLKQFRRYLPTLQLKKQQLQMKILEARTALNQKLSVFYKKEKDIKGWVNLLGDPQVDSASSIHSGSVGISKAESIPSKLEHESIRTKKNLKDWVIPQRILVDTINIAGANVPVFNNIHFGQAEYDLHSTPFWIDTGIQELRLLVTYLAEVEVIKKQIAILEHELRITTQRVNLFEKIKIPECLDNVRVIRIYLGDQQANAVGVSKVAKKKIEAKSLEAALV